MNACFETLLERDADGWGRYCDNIDAVFRAPSTPHF